MTKQTYTNISQRTTLAQVKLIRDAIFDVNTGYNHPSYANAKSTLLGEVDKVKRLVEKIDFGNLTSRQRQIVGAAIFEGLTQMKDQVTLRSHKRIWDRISPKAHSATYKQQTMLQLVVNEQSANATVTEDPGVESLTAWQPDGSKAAVEFPSFTTSNTQLADAYNRLRETWEQATLRVMSVEDTYLVVALATTYLPESIGLLQRLSKHSTLARTQCEQMFLEQLGLMQRQLDAVLAKESDTVLSAMQAQTRFLASKIPVVTAKVGL